ncbi:hypothetical protein APHAL10511_004600 [Amanita phalloides]|nr:hypothetical protein APHAL10511_004600 [Amanita phalloides]
MLDRGANFPILTKNTSSAKSSFPQAPSFTEMGISPNFDPDSVHVSNMASGSLNATFDVFPIPVPAADTHIRKYRELRLAALKMDPYGFSSTYERESQFSDETWHERVDGTDRINIIGRVVVNPLRSTRSDDPSNSNSAGDGDDEGTWVGLATTMSPQRLRNLNFHIPEAIEGSLVYALAGVWVHPEHRKKGLAKELHRATIDWIKRHAKCGNGNDEKKIILLVMVKEDNTNARSLYTHLGYQDLGVEIVPHCLTQILHVD